MTAKIKHLDRIGGQADHGAEQANVLLAGYGRAGREVAAAERLVIAACGRVRAPAAAVTDPVWLVAADDQPHRAGRRGAAGRPVRRAGRRPAGGRPVVGAP